MIKFPKACTINQRAGLLQQKSTSTIVKVNTQNKTWTKMSNTWPSTDGSRNNFKQTAVAIQKAEKRATQPHMLTREAVSFRSMPAVSLDDFILEVSGVAGKLVAFVMGDGGSLMHLSVMLPLLFLAPCEVLLERRDVMVAEQISLATKKSGV
jgi:hypothetical protein